MKRRKTWIVGVASVAIATAGVGAQETGGKIGPPAELSALPQRWEAAMEELGVPGMAVVVVRGDEVFYLDTFGVRDPSQERPVTPDTIFYIASCTKSFMAMAVLSLAEEGKLKLSDPVKKHLPRFELADEEATDTITIEDLLSHRKGLRSEPIVTLDAFTGEITEDRFYYWLEQVEPEGGFRYTNLHYTLAGRVVDAVTDKSWKDFLAERIFKPAGMYRTTAYASRMYGNTDCAIPCVEEDGKLVAAPVRKTDRLMHAAGGMGASARDLGRWLRLNLSGGRIDGVSVLSAEGVKRMQALQAEAGERGRGIPNRKDLGYGLGWAIGQLGGERYVDHGGGYVGTAASISMMPEHHIGVAVLVNAGVPITELVAMDVYDQLLGLEIEDILPRLTQMVERRRSRPSSTGPNVAERDGLSLAPEAYVGTYVNPHWGRIEVVLRNGKLVGSNGDLPIELLANGKDAFVALDGTNGRSNGTFEVHEGRVVGLHVEIAEEGEPMEFVRREVAGK